jgi:heme A synthase
MLARITALLGAPRISRARRQVDDPRPRRRAIATMRGVRALAVLVAAIVVWSGLAAGAATAAPARVAWSPCHAKLGPFQCGTVQVPLD